MIAGRLLNLAALAAVATAALAVAELRWWSVGLVAPCVGLAFLLDRHADSMSRPSREH